MKFGSNFNRPVNYTPPQTAGDSDNKYPEGEYVAVGIKWAHTDTDNQPALKVQSNAVMSARLYLIVKGKEQGKGPYYLADLPSMNMLVKAFDKDAQLLPIPNEQDSQAVRDFLVYCADKINNSGNEVEFKVAETGFIQYIKGAWIEANCNFLLRVVDIVSKNEQGLPGWYVQKFGEGREAKQFRVRLEILGGSLGNVTPWNGAIFDTNIPYSFVYYDDELDFARNDNGNMNSRGVQLFKFCHVFCPKVFTDEVSSPANKENLVTWMIENKNPLVFMAKVKNNQSKSGAMFYNVDWYNIEIVPEVQLSSLNIKPLELDVPVSTKPQDTIANEMLDNMPFDSGIPKLENVVDLGQDNQEEIDNSDIDTKAQKYLHEALNILANGEVFGETGLTDKGKEIRDKYLIPLKEAGKIPPTKLTQVNFDEGCAILSALIEFIENSELKIKVAHKLDKLQEALLGFDEKEPEQAFDFSDDDAWA